MHVYKYRVWVHIYMHLIVRDRIEMQVYTCIDSARMQFKRKKGEEEEGLAPAASAVITRCRTGISCASPRAAI